MKTGWYIGRFQPFHKGHQAMIEKILEECEICVVLIRGTKKSIDNPYDAHDIEEKIWEWTEKNDISHRVDTEVIDDKGADMTVYYGRKVGWDFKELKLDKETEGISASKIRDDEYHK